MKKQYIFLILIIIILYLSYLIIDYKYKEYKINNHIDYIENKNNKLYQDIIKDKNDLEYMNTKAYKNKTLKEELWYKNIWENVIFITNEEKYNKYTQNEIVDFSPIIQEKQIWDNMDIFEKWMYFLFKKDIR